MIDPRHPRLSIVRQCALVGISRSSFYYEGKEDSPLNLVLMRLIVAQFLETPWYGSRQMARHLWRPGIVSGASGCAGSWASRRSTRSRAPASLTPGTGSKRVYVDNGYRGHNAPKPLRVFRSGQKRGVFGAIKRELRRRLAIEAVIAYLKTDGHLGRNYLKGRHGDRANPILTAAGYNLRLVLRWLRRLLRPILSTILAAFNPISALSPAS